MNKNNRLQHFSSRRRLLAASAMWPALAWMSPVRAQPKPPVVIGWLNNTSRKANLHYLVAFKEGLASYGWKEGASYRIEERWAESAREKLQSLAQDLAAKKPAVVLSATVGATLAASKAMPDVPIVQGDGGSLIAVGLAKSLAHPGGRVTGMTNIAIEFGVKFLELLLETIPAAKRIGFLVDAMSPTMSPLEGFFRKQVESRRIQGTFVRIARPAEIEEGMAKFEKDRIQGLVLLPASFFVAERERIVKIAMANRWPVSCGPHEFAEHGALLCYGPDRAALYRRAAYYVDRILKGTQPSELPIEQPTIFDLVLNLKTAKTLGITVPPTVMVRATKVIE